MEDCGYPKEHIQTRLQCRVRKRPSDEGKSSPVDIAVFQWPQKLEEELSLVVECKKKTRKDGVAQLKLHLDMSAAEVVLCAFWRPIRLAALARGKSQMNATFFLH